MSSRLVQAFKTHRSSLPWALAKRLLAKIVRVETLIIYSRDLPACLPKSGAQDATPRLLRVDNPQQDPFIRLCQKHPEKKFAERLQRESQQCFVAMHDNFVSGYAWVTRADLYLDEIACRFNVADDELFIYDCYVEPEYRGAGIYPAMLKFILDDSCRVSSLKRACIAAAAVNRASIRGILKAGFVEQRRIRYVKYRRKQHWWGIDPLGQV